MPKPENVTRLGGEDLTTEEYEQLLDGIHTVTPNSSSLKRLLDATTFEKRLDRFAEPLSALLDVSTETASELLAGVDNTLEWQAEPGLTDTDAIWVEGGPAVRGCIRGFVRIKAKQDFPEHGHLGEEVTLVLQGRMKVDDGRIFGPGDIYVAGPDVTHSLLAMEGPDLLYFVVVRDGIRIGDMEIHHRDT